MGLTYLKLITNEAKPLQKIGYLWPTSNTENLNNDLETANGISLFHVNGTNEVNRDKWG